MEPVPSIKIHKSTPFSCVSSSCKAECMSDALTAESAIPLPCSVTLSDFARDDLTLGIVLKLS